MKKTLLYFLLLITVPMIGQTGLFPTYGASGIKGHNSDSCNYGNGNNITKDSSTEYSIDYSASQEMPEVRISVLVDWDPAAGTNVQKAVNASTVGNGTVFGFETSSTDFEIDRIESLGDGGSPCDWTWNRRFDFIVRYIGANDNTTKNVTFVFNKNQFLKSNLGNDYEEITINLAFKPSATLKNGTVEDSDFTFAPNPAKTHINVAASSPIDSVELMNGLGQQIATTQIGAVAGTIDVASLPKGMYVLKAIIGNTSIIRRVVVD